MTPGVPTDEQLARIESGVVRRIERRAAVRSATVALSVLVAVVLGGGLLLRPIASGFASSGSAGGSNARSGSVTVVLCHRGSSVGSAATAVPLKGPATAAAAIRACAASTRGSSAAAAGTPASPGPSPHASTAPVVCRDRTKRLHVLVADEDPATQCRRNGMSGP